MKRPPLWLVLVVFPAVVLVGLHLAGARAYLAVLSGTVVGGPVETLLAVAYVLSWFAVIITAPIVVLARVLTASLAASARLLRRRLNRRTRRWVVARAGLAPCGAERDRTVGLLNAIQALSQLSYSPDRWLPASEKSARRN